MLRLAPPLTLALFLVPIATGLVGTLLPAFDYAPALGRATLSLEPWRQLLETPGIAETVLLTVRVGLLATFASVALAIGFCAMAQNVRVVRKLQRLVAPLLATPHAALAIGFAFLILPSGWLVRLVSPELTGWVRPPPLVTVRDPLGLAFTAGLLLKEVPYLVLMIVGATTQVRVREMLAASRALGYRPAKAWLAVVLPQIYPQIRLPVYAVLAFSLSVVDVALVLAPGTPPPLAVLAMRWFVDYDLALYPRAAAAAVLQFGLVVAGIGLWWLAERIAMWSGRRWIAGGRRDSVAGLLIAACAGVAGLCMVAAVAALAGMTLWSVADTWSFPDALPTVLTGEVWSRHVGELRRPVLATIGIGIAATLVALALTLACLEHEQRRRLRPGVGALWLLYLPLLVPQIAFLFGVQIVLVRVSIDGTFAAVVWSHLLFVLPYVFLSLADPYRALDPRYARAAAGLGAGPWRIFVRVKLPMLTRPLLIAAAVGFAVSVGLYLPTLFAGAGRVATLTTDAVTLAAGADRRILGVYTVLQAALPALLFAAALIVPRLIFRNRRGIA